MRRTAVDDIQRSLNAIRAQADEADWQTRFEVLQLMLAASDSIVANAKKLSAPKRKIASQPMPVAKRPKPTSKPRTAEPQSAPSSKPVSPAIEPQNPVPPLNNQQRSV